MLNLKNSISKDIKLNKIFNKIIFDSLINFCFTYLLLETTLFILLNLQIIFSLNYARFKKRFYYSFTNKRY